MMAEPLCIWKDCSNRVKLYSREYGIRICTRDCLELYVKYKEDSAEEGRFRNLWFLHISLLQQWFYERMLYGKSDILEKLANELVFHNGEIAKMAQGNEQILREGLTQYTQKTMAFFEEMMTSPLRESQREEWKKSIMNLLDLLQLSTVPTLVEAMKNYTNHLLQLMLTIGRNEKNHYCIFRVLVITVENLSNLIESNLAKEAPREIPTMMLRPENGRRRQTQKEGEGK